MSERSPDLYKELQSNSINIFKGDLNGRKLISDLCWPETTPFEKSLRGFNVNLVLFRTLKAETLSGMNSSFFTQTPNNLFFRLESRGLQQNGGKIWARR